MMDYTLTPFLSFYSDDLPSKLTIGAELDIWYHKWNNV